MGVSAQVASLKRQLAARDEEIRALKRQLDGLEAMDDFAQRALDGMKAEIAQHVKAVKLVMPIVDAAVDLVLTQDGEETGDADEAMRQLRIAVHVTRAAVLAAEPAPAAPPAETVEA